MRDSASSRPRTKRRKIERDLHDGAQQRMVSVAVTLGLAESQFKSDPDSAMKLIAQAREEAQLAVKELRELARGIIRRAQRPRPRGGARGARRARSRAGRRAASRRIRSRRRWKPPPTSSPPRR